MGLKSQVRTIVPEPVLGAYHRLLARAAARWYGNPSRSMRVIGVTGTNGKSSTVQYIGRILEKAGHRVGWTSTVGFKVADREWINDRKMTMLGRFQTQKLLKEMVDAGCEYAIVETSSQGILQSRHVGIGYDVVVFTNLTPEHIEAHGGFENYKREKGKLFSFTASLPMKMLKGKEVPRAAVVNLQDGHTPYFLSLWPGMTYGFGMEGRPMNKEAAARGGLIPILVHDLQIAKEGSTFVVDKQTFCLHPIGFFNVQNVLAAIGAVRALGLDWKTIAEGVAKLEPVPGRLEVIEEGQVFTVVVDYAYEPAALRACYAALDLLPVRRRLQIVGSTGG